MIILPQPTQTAFKHAETQIEDNPIPVKLKPKEAFISTNFKPLKFQIVKKLPSKRLFSISANKFFNHKTQYKDNSNEAQ